MNKLSRKIYLPSNLTRDDLKCFTEVFAAVPFMGEETYDLVCQAAGSHNRGLFDKLWFNGIEHPRVQTIEECDYVVVPYKFNKDDPRFPEICKQAAEFDKKVVCFYNDDNGEVFDLPSNMILFRTSLYKSLQQPNEYAWPVLIPDHGSNVFSYGHSERVSFCGQQQGIRAQIIKDIQANPNLVTDFIIRDHFWAAGIPKLQARREYYKNMMGSLYTLCMRGCGNFSYRFYEALSFGRVPIFVDTDCVLPFDRIGRWNEFIPVITPDQVSTFDPNDNGPYMRDEMRAIWQDYLSPEGFYLNMFREIEKF